MTLRQSPSGAFELIAVGDLDPTGSTAGQVPTSTGPDTPPTWQDPGGGGGDVPPLWHTYYVDSQTNAPILEQDGSIAKPFFTLTYALEVIFANVSNVLLLVVPGDYSGEPPLVIPSNVKVQIQGLPFPGSGTPFDGVNVKIGGISQTLGGEQGSLVLQNLECGGNWALVGDVTIIDCQAVSIVPGTDGVDPSPAGFNIRGGSLVGIDAAGGFIDGTAFGPSPVSITLAAAALQVTNSQLLGMQPTVTFAEEGGIVKHDLQTEGTAGASPPFVVNLGETQRLALPVQAITGTTEQEQIDSIVAALVALGLALDTR